MAVANLEQLLINELKGIYSAEKQITKALPKMAKAATSPELRAARSQMIGFIRPVCRRR
jgi:ferritin-like metal-binding protein YciE